MYSENPPETITSDQDRHSAFLYAQRRAYACMIMADKTDDDHCDLMIHFRENAKAWAMIANALRRLS